MGTSCSGGVTVGINTNCIVGVAFTGGSRFYPLKSRVLQGFLPHCVHQNSSVKANTETSHTFYGSALLCASCRGKGSDLALFPPEGFWRTIFAPPVSDLELSLCLLHFFSRDWKMKITPLLIFKTLSKRHHEEYSSKKLSHSVQGFNVNLVKNIHAKLDCSVIIQQYFRAGKPCENILWFNPCHRRCRLSLVA